MYNSDLPSRADLPSTKQLVRSTLIAAGVAIVILVTAVLPGEYGVDPTGIGRVLGLTQMGEVKQRLAAEAEADAAATAAPAVAEAEVAVEAVTANVAEEPAAAPASEWRDEVTLTLGPGEAAEIKLVMKAGETAGYAWAAKSGALNSDLHGDGKGGQATSYRKGRAESSDSGDLTAAFDGSHGWFWRNRGDAPVELVLQVRGEYSEVKRVL